MPFCFLSHTQTEKSIKIIKIDVEFSVEGISTQILLRFSEPKRVIIIGPFLSLLLYEPEPKAFPKSTGNHLFFKVCTKLVF